MSIAGEIKTKTELKFYIYADRMMNRGRFKWKLRDKFKHLFIPDPIMQYLVSMRYCAFLHKTKSFTPYTFLKYYHKIRFKKLGIRLGFSIGEECLGYGVKIPHYGTIVIGSNNRIGSYAVLHTSTCITGNGKKIGNNLYLSTGAKLTSPIILGDNVTIGANSVVNKSFSGNCLLVGAPAIKKREEPCWWLHE